MKFRINEVKEIKNTEKVSLSQNTVIPIGVNQVSTEEDKKKLERPKYAYVPRDEVRESSLMDDHKRKLR